ncbi:cyclic di-GMP regulator CdgR [Cronobacter turicensis]|nr:cyclic di-GMP regulator CdgR [Cronobacter turicensis]EKM0373491.1 cyclic di-GMP regulator CdgR [Cronobacter turicensis]EKY3195988.1 cyclic di-GMP regulator CdgR [Cronobacter turicensis]ELY3597999.1 cyclic di-GMP regulator CdgR [Cronobacter turicensis]ELY4129697.1 cyclic di-GMP regulator CdgR [Cronobacter turicensis]
MIVSLDTRYQSYLLFAPIAHTSGGPLGMEVIAHFTSLNAQVRFPTEFIIPRINPEERLMLFYEKISLIEKWREAFIKNSLFAVVNIDHKIASAILSSPTLRARLAQLPFLELGINENFPELNKGKENKTMFSLSRYFPLMLCNFGAGAATGRAIFDGLFRRVALDKTFVQKRRAGGMFEPFMYAIANQVGPCCQTLILPAVDNDEALDEARRLGFNGAQGTLWPAMDGETLVLTLAMAQ